MSAVWRLKHEVSDRRTQDTVLVGLNYQSGLVYKLPGTDSYFWVSIRPNGTEIEEDFQAP